MTNEPINIYDEAGYIIGIGYERPHFPIEDGQAVGDPGSCYFCHNPFDVNSTATVLVFNHGLHIATIESITDTKDRGYIGPKRICAKCTDLVPAGSILDRG